MIFAGALGAVGSVSFVSAIGLVFDSSGSGSTSATSVLDSSSGFASTDSELVWGES